jgi:Holliday junction DNA helicase RuvA
MIPGIGQKTAERIILELKDKKLDFGGPATTSKTISSGLFEDLFSALKNLGYKDGKIESVLEKIRAEQPQGDFHVWLRQALNLIRG